jgi:hypothetical protein
MTVLSGQITVTTAGTAVTGATTGPGTFQLTPVHGNTGTYCYVGNDGEDDVSSANGYHIKKDGVPLILTVTDLDEWYFDSDTSGDKIAWVRILGENQGIYPPV